MSVTCRFKQWFWSVVEKMTNEEKHDLVRQRMPLLVVGAWACGIGPYAGQLEVHKFGKAQNSYEYVQQLMRPTVVPGVDCDVTV